MAKIFPFKAVRPTRDKVNLISARPFDSYTKEERASRLRDNPYSFLHIVYPGYKYEKEIVSEQEHHTLVRNRYLEFKEEGYFFQDKTPSIYVYKIVDFTGHQTVGFIAATAVEEYENKVVKRHEETIKVRETKFKEYIKTVGFNPEPVLLTYPDKKQLHAVLLRIMKSRPEYEFTTTQRESHYLWNINDPELVKSIKAEFKEITALYIADGHHRTATAYNIYKDQAEEEKQNNSTAHYFMSYLIPESSLKIYAFNRLVKDLNGWSKEEFLVQLDTVFKIDHKGLQYYKPRQKNQFSMYLDGAFYALSLRKGLDKAQDASETLDSQILFNTVLKPILGMDSPQGNNRLNYANGKKDMTYVQAMVDSGNYAVGFGLCPVTMEAIKEIAEEDLIMPPKTTYIEPKLRNGITIYEY